MNRSARALAAVVTTAALTLTGQALQTAASAKPDHAGSHAVGGQAKGGAAAKVLRDIERTNRALDRTVRENRIGTLAEDVQATVVASVEADKATLAGLAAGASAPASTVDLRDVRRQLHQLRPENYVLSVNVLRKAARLAEAATGDAAVTAQVDSAVASAVATALTVNASSPKSLLREARAQLASAQALLDAASDEAGTGEETDPVTEPAEPVTA
jgi:hypothetical protein